MCNLRSGAMFNGARRASYYGLTLLGLSGLITLVAILGLFVAPEPMLYWGPRASLAMLVVSLYVAIRFWSWAAFAATVLNVVSFGFWLWLLFFSGVLVP